MPMLAFQVIGWVLILLFFIDPARFPDRPMHDHGAAQRGERPFQHR
jgi:hypothetical protein